MTLGNVQTEHEPESSNEREEIPKGQETSKALKRFARIAKSQFFQFDLVSVVARMTIIAYIVMTLDLISRVNHYVLGGFAVLWLWKGRPRFEFGTIFGSARWSNRRDLIADNMIGHRDGLLLGRFEEREFTKLQALIRLLTYPLRDSEHVIRYLFITLTQRFITLPDDNNGAMICAPRGLYTHVLTVAPTGAGKGVGVVIPNLLNYKHSAIVIDLKGENYSKTAEVRRSWGHTVVALNPFNVRNTETGEVIPSATLNPLSLFDIESVYLIDHLRVVAETLVVRTGKEADPHWAERATTLIHAVLLFVMCTSGDEEFRHLDCVKNILSDKDDLERCLLDLTKMKGKGLRGSILAAKGGEALSIPPKEFGSILSFANKSLEFLNSEVIIPSIYTTSFDVHAIKTKPTSIYLILPAEYLHSHANLMRLWVNTLLHVIKRQGASEKNEVLFILDEVAQLGELRPVEEAVTLLRQYGLRIWFILQSLSQIETAYSGPRAKTLLGNFSIQQFFGVSDPETADYVSKMIGKRTEISPNYNMGWTQGNSSGGQSGSSNHGTSGGKSVGAMEREHMKPDEVLREDPRNSVFIFRQGRFPAKVRRLCYFDDPDFLPGSEARPRSRASLVSCVLCVLGIATALYVAKPSFPGFQDQPGGQMNAPGYEPFRPSSGTRKPAPRPVVVTPPHTILVQCPNCGNEAAIPGKYVEKEIRCLECETLLIVRPPSDLPPSEESP